MKTLLLLTSIMEFLGAVLISIDLIKSKQQIADETAQYYDYNPYLLDSAYQQLKLVKIGFVLFIGAFSYKIGAQIQSESLSGAIWTGSGVFLLGILMLALKYIYQDKTHRKKRIAIHRKIFLEVINTVIQDLEVREMYKKAAVLQGRLEAVNRQLTGMEDVPFPLMESYNNLYSQDLLHANDVEQVISKLKEFIDEQL